MKRNDFWMKRKYFIETVFEGQDGEELTALCLVQKRRGDRVRTAWSFQRPFPWYISLLVALINKSRRGRRYYEKKS